MRSNYCKPGPLLDSFDVGYFPHKFSSLKTLHSGALPDKQYFLVEGMRTPELAYFNAWYDAKKEQCRNWDFQEQMMMFCRQEVHILAMAVGEFSQNMREVVLPLLLSR